MLDEHEEVTVTVDFAAQQDGLGEECPSEIEEAKAARGIPDDLVPPNMRHLKHLLDADYYLTYADEIRNPDPVPLEEVRRMTAHIKESFSDLIRQDRDAD